MGNNDYVSYEVAKRLKAAGFDWPCSHYYCAFDNETDVRFWSVHPEQSQNAFRSPEGKVIADAPTLWQAQKWLREVGKYDMNIDFDEEATKPYTLKIYRNKECILQKWELVSHSSYENAVSAGIQVVLDMIEHFYGKPGT